MLSRFRLGSVVPAQQLRRAGLRCAVAGGYVRRFSAAETNGSHQANQSSNSEQKEQSESAQREDDVYEESQSMLPTVIFATILGAGAYTAYWYMTRSRMSRYGMQSELEEYLKKNAKVTELIGPIEMFYDGRSGSPIQYREEVLADGVKRAVFSCEVKGAKTRAIITCQVNEHQKKGDFERLMITPHEHGRSQPTVILVDNLQPARTAFAPRAPPPQGTRVGASAPPAAVPAAPAAASGSETGSASAKPQRGKLWDLLLSSPDKSSPPKQ